MVRDKSKLPISIQENKKVNLILCDIRESNKYRKEETPITPPIIGPITGIHEYDQLEFPFPGIGKM